MFAPLVDGLEEDLAVWDSEIVTQTDVAEIHSVEIPTQLDTQEGTFVPPSRGCVPEPLSIHWWRHQFQDLRCSRCQGPTRSLSAVCPLDAIQQWRRIDSNSLRSWDPSYKDGIGIFGCRGFVGGVESQAHVDAECPQIP